MIQAIFPTTLYNVCSVHRGMFIRWGDIMMHVGGGEGGKHEYIGGCSVRWTDTMIHVADIIKNKLTTEFNECFRIEILRFLSH